MFKYSLFGFLFCLFSNFCFGENYSYDVNVKVYKNNKLISEKKDVFCSEKNIEELKKEEKYAKMFLGDSDKSGDIFLKIKMSESKSKYLCVY